MATTVKKPMGRPKKEKKGKLIWVPDVLVDAVLTMVEGYKAIRVKSKTVEKSQ